ncbi:MAG: hypothetical protein AB8H80_10800 [Planctomycetota bacterium]
MRLKKPATVLFASLALALGACSGSSGSSDPQIPASVPAGAGNVAIDMSGTWEIRDATIVESNFVGAEPPLNNTPFLLNPDEVVSVANILVTPATLELLAGAPLEFYVNTVTDRRFFYAWASDRRPNGENRFELAVAGGAIDADTILVEQFESILEQGQVEPFFERSQYRLVRVAGAPAMLDPASEEAKTAFERVYGAR